MILTIVAIVLVLGITFVHSIHGIFSGLINALCAIVAMVITFTFTDALNEFLTSQELHPAYTLPICFVVLFFVAHLVLRMAADNLVRGNVRVSMYVDWGGGGICGFIIAQITVGMLVLGFLMLPIGGRAMMFSRYSRLQTRDRDTNLVEFKRNHVGLFLRPDEFTVGLFNLLSSGSLRSQTTFASVYPDYAEWVFWSGNTVQNESVTSPFRDSRSDGWNEGGIKVLTWWWQREPVSARYRALVPQQDQLRFDNPFDTVTFRPRMGRQLLGIRVKLPKASADRDEGTPFHRFRSTMLRVVGDLNGRPRHYVARILGGAEGGQNEYRLADIDNNFAIPDYGDTKLDLFFEVDQGFQPRFVEYRRHARAPLKNDLLADAAPGGEPLVGAAQATAASRGGVSPFRFLQEAIDEGGTGDVTALPFTMALNALSDAEIVDGKYKSGRIYGRRSDLEAAGPISTVNEFWVPEGYRLFQLRCSALNAYTLARGVFNYVGATVNQYIAVDHANRRYMLAGYYVIVSHEDGETHFEMYLTGEPDFPGYNSMLDLQHVQRARMRRREAVIGLLFYVRPGCYIRSVQNQANNVVSFTGNGYKMAD